MLASPQWSVLQSTFSPAAKTLVAELPETYSRSLMVPLVIAVQEDPELAGQATAKSTVAVAPVVTLTWRGFSPSTVQFEANPPRDTWCPPTATAVSWTVALTPIG